MEALPGVVHLLSDAAQSGVPCAVASSSGREWVEKFLLQLGIRDRFTALATRDMVAFAKPAPDLYIAACNALAVPAQSAIALEDSLNGITAAKAAGLACVAVPNPVTKHVDLGIADALVTSLEQTSVSALEQIVAKARLQAPSSNH
jgi:beta-phosphoglucomutase-like phosphatase (HAD superfamily)